MVDLPNLTDRRALLLHRQRAATAPQLFLHEEAAVEVQERLDEVNKSFTTPLLVGHATPPFADILPSAIRVSDDPVLSVTTGRHDLVVHCFGLHWADDPVGQLVQSRLALASDGLFMGVLCAGATLNELRACLAEVEAKQSGGLSPRILPMGDLRDLGGLLQRAGFALPVADSVKLTVRYRSLSDLVRDLRGMGETNALAQRHTAYPGRNFFRKVEQVYRSNFGDHDGLLPATFELVFLTGWAPSETQQKPLAPGSAQGRLADVLGVKETKLHR